MVRCAKHTISALLLMLFLFVSAFFFRVFAEDTPTPTPSTSTSPTATPSLSPSPTPTSVPGATATPTPTCSSTAAPSGLAAASSGPTQITLTWTEPSGTIDHYILSYGTSTGSYTYGSPNVGGKGTTTYTVSSLSKGTKYYFAMKTDSGCSTSSYSSEVSATAGETPSTTPTPSPTPEQQEPPVYQTSNAQQYAPQQAVQAAQAGQGGKFVTIPTLSPTPTDSPLGSTVNLITYTGAAVVIFIVCVSLFYWLQSRQGEKTPPHEKVEF